MPPIFLFDWKYVLWNQQWSYNTEYMNWCIRYCTQISVLYIENSICTITFNYKEMLNIKVYYIEIKTCHLSKIISLGKITAVGGVS